MNDDDRIHVRTPFEIVATLPHVIGYHPEDTQVILVGLDRASGAMQTGVGEPRPLDTASRDAAALAESLEQSFRKDGVDDYRFVVAYGPDSQERALAWAGPLQRHASAHVSVQAFAVHDGKLSQYDRRGGWSTPVPVPNHNAEIVLAGRQLATGHGHEEFLRRFDPAPSPTWEPLGADERDSLAALPPQSRAAAVRSLVDALAAPDATNVESQRANLAAIMSSGAIYRDIAALHAVGREHATTALLDAYKTAPNEDRPVLATAAATAHIMSGRAVTGALRVLDQVPEGDPNTEQRNLLRQLVSAGVSTSHQVAPLVESSREAITDSLSELQQIWKTAQLHRASYPLAADAAAQAPRVSMGAPAPTTTRTDRAHNR